MMRRGEAEAALTAVRQALGNDILWDSGSRERENLRGAEAGLLALIAIYDEAEAVSVDRLVKVPTEAQVRELLTEAVLRVLPQYSIIDVTVAETDMGDETAVPASQIEVFLEWVMT